MTPDEKVAIRARAARAEEELDRLRESRIQWRWSIPANPERDSDLIIGASQADVPTLLAALESLEEARITAEAKIAEAWDEGLEASINADLGDWENPPDIPANPYRAVEDVPYEGPVPDDFGGQS